jgi:hypothetical protein
MVTHRPIELNRQMEMLSTEVCLPSNLTAAGHGTPPSDGQPKAPLGVYLGQDVPSVEAVTDGGRPIPLFVYQASYIVRHEQEFNVRDPAQFRWAYCASETEFLKNTNQDVSKLRRVADPFLASNCHGWVFAGGRFAISDEFVPEILSDHQYFSVTDPVEGDLAVYWAEGVVKHTGFVRRSPGGAVMVESKWGPFGVFQHPPEAYAFKGDCGFYRTARRQHGLQLRAVSR